MRGGFAQVWQDTIDAVGDRLTPAQWGLLLRLVARIGRADTVPRHGRYRDGDPLTISDIADLVGWTREHTSRQLAMIERETGLLRGVGEGSRRHVILSLSLAHRYARRRPNRAPRRP